MSTQGTNLTIENMTTVFNISTCTDNYTRCDLIIVYPCMYEYVYVYLRQNK